MSTAPGERLYPVGPPQTDQIPLEPRVGALTREPPHVRLAQDQSSIHWASPPTAALGWARPFGARNQATGSGPFGILAWFRGLQTRGSDQTKPGLPRAVVWCVAGEH